MSCRCVVIGLQVYSKDKAANSDAEVIIICLEQLLIMPGRVVRLSGD